MSYDFSGEHQEPGARRHGDHGLLGEHAMKTGSSVPINGMGFCSCTRAAGVSYRRGRVMRHSMMMVVWLPISNIAS